MVDLSLHILDLMENSLRAGASVICITVEEKRVEDWMAIVVEDNGRGFPVPPERASDPFYTTKKGKRTGLGLSLFRTAAEQAGGQLTFGTSKLGGAWVQATLRLSHVDRVPLGDLASSFSSMVCANPDVDLWCILRVDDRESEIKVSEVMQEISPPDRGGLAVARLVSEKIKTGMEEVGIVE